MRIQERIYRTLLLAYPPKHRREFGEPMVQMMRDRLRDEGGGARTILVWVQVLADLVRTAAKERAEANMEAARLRRLERRHWIAGVSALGAIAVVSLSIFAVWPGGDSETSGPATRVVVSPLVEVSEKFGEQQGTEMFSVQVREGDYDYWRLMSLDEFDGRLWKASSSFEPAVGEVASTLDPSVPTREIVQTITTTRNLGNIYLPVAFELSEVIDDGGVDLEYEAESAALVVTREAYVNSIDGFTYTIESVVPVFDPARLGTVSAASLDAGFINHYTDVPEAVPEPIRVEAERITVDAASDYERALALQNHFRGNFTYDAGVDLEHDATDIETFLFDERSGFSEQFASAFAVMARSVGLPSRVAVGFTWGDWDETRGEFVVRGEHTHAWPEVFFAGTGWVRFEPTPGRA